MDYYTARMLTIGIAVVFLAFAVCVAAYMAQRG